MEKKIFAGKFEQINGSWYAVSVQAYTVKEAIKSLYIGQIKPYGIVEAIKGRFTFHYQL